MLNKTFGVKPSILITNRIGCPLYKISVRNIRDISRISEILYPIGAVGMRRKMLKMREVSTYYSTREAA